MTKSAQVMDGYIRVSQVAGRSGDRFQSPDTQREAIEGWARLHGVKIAAWHEDLDRSGGTMDRPGMNEIMRRVEAGKTGGVIVARLDRFARTVIGGLTTIRELDRHGARVVSVAEGVDPATPMGRAMLGLLLIMAEWQRDQAIEHLQSAQRRATSAGRFPGKAAFGYKRDDAGLTLVDEPAAAIVHRIFTARAAGVGWRKIADDLTRDGIPTPTGRERWAMTTVIGIVKSEAPIGVFVGPNEMRIEGAWPAIVDPELWAAANAVQGVRDNERQHHDRLFAGIARCACCRYVLKRAVNPGGFVSYGCMTRGCAGRGSMSAALLDEHVGAFVDERLAKIALAPQVADDGGEGARLVAARDAAVRELEAWRDDVEMRAALGEHDYREGMLVRARARDDAETALADYRAQGAMPELDELPDGVVPTLEALPWAVRRKVVERLLHSVWVRKSGLRGPAARRAVDQRVRVVWSDERDRPALPSRYAAEHPPLQW